MLRISCNFFKHVYRNHERIQNAARAKYRLWIRLMSYRLTDRLSTFICLLPLTAKQSFVATASMQDYSLLLSYTVPTHNPNTYFFEHFHEMCLSPTASLKTRHPIAVLRWVAGKTYLGPSHPHLSSFIQYRREILIDISSFVFKIAHHVAETNRRHYHIRRFRYLAASHSAQYPTTSPPPFAIIQL